MPSFLHTFFHNETNDRSEKGRVHIPKDIDLWPESWKNVFYKEYINFKHVPLPRTDGILDSLLSKRSSNKELMLSNKLTLDGLAYILKCGYGFQGDGHEEEKHRTVPSAGGLYPLDMYVFLFKKVDDCRTGIYHYNVRSHALEPVVYKDFTEEEISLFADAPWLIEAHAILCVTGTFERTVGKYGSRGYRYMLLESGHVVQNMLLAATEKGLKGMPFGGVWEERIEKAIGLQSERERVLYVVFL